MKHALSDRYGRLRLGLRVLLLVVLAALGGCDLLGERTVEDHLAAASEHEADGELRAALIELRNAVQKDPQSAVARERLGLMALRTGDTGSAAKELARALELGHPAEELIVPLAQALVGEGELQRVLELKLADDAPSAARLDLLSARGYALRGLGRREAACHAFETVVTENPGHLGAGLGMARCEAEDDDLEAAAARLEALRSVHPDAARLWRLTGDVAAARGNTDAAMNAYDEALARVPRDAVARIARARLHLVREDYEAAAEDAEVAREVADGSPLPHFMLGQVHFRQERLADAASAFQEALNRDAGHRPSRLWLGITQFARENHQQAVQHLQGYLRSGPSAPQVRLLLAASEARLGATDRARSALSPLATAEVSDTRLLAEIGRAALRLGDSGLGQDFLQRAVDSDPADPGARIRLASVLLDGGQTDRAIEQLGEAATLDSATSDADLLLIRALIQRQEYEKALAAIDRLEQKDTETGRPLVLRGMVYLLQGADERARALFEKAAEHEGSAVAAHHGLATLAVRAGDFETARAEIRAALEMEPDNLSMLLAMASVEQRAGDVEAMIGRLREAVEVRPDSVPAQLLYARALLGNDQQDAALEALDAALERHPDEQALLSLKGVALLERGALDEAEQTFERLAELAPESARPYVALARVHMAREEVESARAALEQALERDAEDAQALLTLARIEARVGRGERAVALAKRLRAAAPELREGYEALAEAHVAAGEIDAATGVLAEARARFPENRTIALQLARFQAAGASPSAARETLQQWTEQAPDDAFALRSLADLHLQVGARQQAIDAYERVLELRPDDAATLNNLATLKSGTAPAEALELARRAHEQAPDSPHVQDTLGWLLLEHGGESERGRALELLASAREALADNAEVRLHYATALTRHGTPGEARAELKALIDAFPESAEAEQARALLAQL